VGPWRELDTVNLPLVLLDTEIDLVDISMKSQNKKEKKKNIKDRNKKECDSQVEDAVKHNNFLK